MSAVEKCHFCGMPLEWRGKYEAKFTCGTIRPVDADERRSRKCMETEQEKKA